MQHWIIKEIWSHKSLPNFTHGQTTLPNWRTWVFNEASSHRYREPIHSRSLIVPASATSQKTQETSTKACVVCRHRCITQPPCYDRWHLTCTSRFPASAAISWNEERAMPPCAGTSPVCCEIRRLSAIWRQQPETPASASNAGAETDSTRQTAIKTGRAVEHICISSLFISNLNFCLLLGSECKITGYVSSGTLTQKNSGKWWPWKIWYNRIGIITTWIWFEYSLDMSDSANGSLLVSGQELNIGRNFYYYKALIYEHVRYFAHFCLGPFGTHEFYRNTIGIS
jgi:hypothetical protein